MLESLRVTALGSKQSLPPGFPPTPLYVNQADSCTPIAFGASYMNIPYTYRGRDRLSLSEVWPTRGERSGMSGASWDVIGPLSVFGESRPCTYAQPNP